jgi:hypothetical protein
VENPLKAYLSELIIALTLIVIPVAMHASVLYGAHLNSEQSKSMAISHATAHAPEQSMAEGDPSIHCGMHSSEGDCDHKQIGAVTGFGETDPASQMEGRGTIHGRDFTASKPEELVVFAETDTASDMMSQTTGIALVSVSSDDARQLSQHGQTNSIEVHRGNDRMTRCNC